MTAIPMGGPRGRRPAPSFRPWWFGAAGLTLVSLGAVAVAYEACKVEVDTGRQAVLIRRAGRELTPDMELAPTPEKGGAYYKGVQAGVLTEGRYFYNPFYWAWEVTPSSSCPTASSASAWRSGVKNCPRARSWPSPARRGSCVRP